MVTSLWRVKYTAKHEVMRTDFTREVFVAADTFSKASLLAMEFCRGLPPLSDAKVVSVSDMGAKIFLEQVKI